MPENLCWGNALDNILSIEAHMEHVKSIYEHLENFFFFCRGGKMAKSCLEVVHDAPRTGLGIPNKTKKTPLSNQYTARGTAFWL